MNLPRPISEDDVEALVRGYLLDDGQRVDVARNLAEIARRLLDEPAAPSNPLEVTSATDQPNLVQIAPEKSTTRHAPRRWQRWGVAASLAAVVGLCGFYALSPEPAEAYALVTAARAALDAPLDRCYRLESDLPRVWVRRNPFLGEGHGSVVWTRGDRFRVVTQIDGREFTWGQDEHRMIWVVDDAGQGLEFEPREVPPMLARTRGFLVMDLRLLVKRFLDDCDLQVESRRKTPQGPVVVIRATHRDDRPGRFFNSALVELEMKTKVIRRMELERQHGGVRGTFTLTLFDVGSQTDSSYDVEGNIRPDAQIYGPDRPAERDARFDQLLQTRRILERAAPPTPAPVPTVDERDLL